MQCRRLVKVPAGLVRMAEREGRPYPVFCSRRCNVRYVAIQGRQQQEIRAWARRES
jgi:hypothetical protein